MKVSLLGLALNCEHSESVQVILLGLVLSCEHSVSVAVNTVYQWRSLLLLGLVLNCEQCVSEGHLTETGIELEV